jgi:hypothetical protein
VVPHSYAKVVLTGREGGIVPPNPPCWLEKLYDWWLSITLKIRGYFAAKSTIQIRGPMHCTPLEENLT